MAEYIEREAVLSKLLEYGIGWGAAKVKGVIQSIPAADVQPVRHGRYIIDDNGDSSCSECGEWYLDVTKNYCPNCGARLDLEAERW